MRGVRSDRQVSIAELALRLKVTPHVLTSAGRSANLVTDAGDMRAIALAELPALLTAFRNLHGRTHVGWDVPPWLADSEEPVLRVLAELYREPMTRPASLPPSQGRQLRDLILATRPAWIVEIGSFLGLPTLWMTSALRDIGVGHIDAVDPFEPKLPFAPSHCGCVVDSLEFVNASLAHAGVQSMVTLHAMRSQRFARRLREKRQRGIDFLFIDGDHSVGGCLDDFVSFYPFVRRGGHILLHDIHPARCGWRGPRYLLDQFLASDVHFEIQEIVTEPDYGMALIKKLTDAEHLPSVGRLHAAAIRYPHRALQTVVTNSLTRRILKPLQTQWQLWRTVPR